MDFTKRALMPLFRLAAKPGLGLPHAAHEIELLQKGAKPTAILGEDSLKLLEDQIRNGDLVVISKTSPPPIEKTIVTRPENAHKFKEVQQRAQESWNKITADLSDGPEDLLPFAPQNFNNHIEEIAYIQSTLHTSSMLFHIYPVSRDAFQRGKISSGKMDNNNLAAIAEEKARLIMDGEILFTALEKFEMESIHDLLQSGQLQAHNVTIDRSHFPRIVIVAQKDRIADGQRLSAINNDNMPEDMRDVMEDPNISKKDKSEYFHGEVGRLLGYTSEDIAFFQGKATCSNPFEAYILNHTEDLRRWCRKQVMLADAEDKQSAAPPPQAMDI